jgi:hypothetical protein
MTPHWFAATLSTPVNFVLPDALVSVSVTMLNVAASSARIRRPTDE